MSAPSWPRGGGSMGELVRRHDWSSTSLGPLDGWPAHLRTSVDIVLHSPMAMVLMWGPQHVMIYNDDYIQIAGGRHPAALGGTVPLVWPEIWDWNARILAAGLRGETQVHRERCLPLLRDGKPTDVCFDLFYTPVHGDGGHPICVDRASAVILFAIEQPAVLCRRTGHRSGRPANARLTTISATASATVRWCAALPGVNCRS